MRCMRLLILLIFLSSMIIAACSSAPGKYDTFAQCLTEKGVRMYGASWCPHCQEQKAEFGRSWKLVAYVECAAADGGQTKICKDEGITGYPTWKFSDGQKKEGKLGFDELSRLSGCGI